MSTENPSTPRVFILDFTREPSDSTEYLTIADPAREARLRQAATEIGGVTITAVGGENDQYITVYRQSRTTNFIDDNGNYNAMIHYPTDHDPIATTSARPVGEGNSVLSISPASLAGKVTLRSADIGLAKSRFNYL